MSFKQNISSFTDMLLLGDDIYVYPFVSQGKITVPSIDDFEEMKMTHVRKLLFEWFIIVRCSDGLINTGSLRSSELLCPGT